MSPRLAIRLAFIRRAKGPAAVSSCPSLLRVRHFSNDAARSRGKELVIDDDGSHHISPVVLCDRGLDGWTQIARTVIRGVIR